jgi:predicted DNA-binding transcriptional regulator YafY
MTRAARLLDLMQVLRRHRRPVTAQTLAAELHISARTMYRDIATLQGQGVPIEGAAGLGYVLRPGFMLPPLTFTGDELEAVAIGLQWSAQQGDHVLAAAARDALAKIAAVLPAAARIALDTTGLLVPPRAAASAPDPHLGTLRRAIRDERRAQLTYTDLRGNVSTRTVWPVVIGFFDSARVLAAWCELRSDFRHFRIDRITEVQVLPAPLPRRRAALLDEWRARLLTDPDSRRA